MPAIGASMKSASNSGVVPSASKNCVSSRTPVVAVPKAVLTDHVPEESR